MKREDGFFTGQTSQGDQEPEEQVQETEAERQWRKQVEHYYDHITLRDLLVEECLLEDLLSSARRIIKTVKRIREVVEQEREKPMRPRVLA